MRLWHGTCIYTGVQIATDSTHKRRFYHVSINLHATCRRVGTVCDIPSRNPRDLPHSDRPVVARSGRPFNPLIGGRHELPHRFDAVRNGLYVYPVRADGASWGGYQDHQ